MPRMIQSAAVDMAGWEPAPARTQVAMQPSDPTAQKNPAMLASMPAMASTADVFQRQFYGGANIPSFRILPGRKAAL